MCEIDETAELKEYKRDLEWLVDCKKDFTGWCKRGETASKEDSKVAFTYSYDISGV